jgi:glycosyltransferase involved in cell wall biosynthesis
VALTFHSGGYPSGKAGREAHPRSLRGFILRRLDALIAVNPEIGVLFRRLGVPAARIHLICPYTPVSVPGDDALPENIRTFRQTHTPLITTVGLLEPEYDLPLQIRALAKVRRARPKAGLVIIGSGSLESELRRMIAEEPEGRHVLLCGDVPHAHTLRVIQASDVFLRTTHYDGDSVSVREALQLGVPVIATDNGMRPPGIHLLQRPDADTLTDMIDTVLRQPPPPPVEAAGHEQHLDDLLALYSTLAGQNTNGSMPLTR